MRQSSGFNVVSQVHHLLDRYFVIDGSYFLDNNGASSRSEVK